MTPEHERSLDRVYRTPAILLAADLIEDEAVVSRLIRERDEAREQVRSLTERVKAIRRARDEVKAAGESVAPRNDPAAREALFARMSAAEKALSGLLEAL